MQNIELASLAAVKIKLTVAQQHLWWEIEKCPLTSCPPAK
jgi:hypothetical protein